MVATLRSAALRAAMEEHDTVRLSESLSTDVVLHSPVLSVPFVGRDAVGPLLAVVRGQIDEFHVQHQMADDSADVLVFGGTLAGEPLEAAVLLRFDADGQVRELTAFFRPLRALAAFAGAAGPPLARGRLRADALRILAPGLAVVARMTDWVSRHSLRLD